MDLEQIKYLTDEQKDRYLKMARLFEAPGWDILENWAKKNAEEAKERAASAATWEQNRIAVGLRIAYDTFSKLREINEEEYIALSNENRVAKEGMQEDEADYE